MIEIRALEPGDWERVRAIYAEGIATGDATFETEPPDWETWDADHLAECRIVAVAADGVVGGWAALTSVSDRCVYGGVGEVSVYVGSSARGQGVGTQLMRELVARSERAGLWTLQAGVFPENEASVRAHERVGFRVVGQRERLGKLAGKWRDVLLLERRSARVGND